MKLRKQNFSFPALEFFFLQRSRVFRWSDDLPLKWIVAFDTGAEFLYARLDIGFMIFSKRFKDKFLSSNIKKALRIEGLLIKKEIYDQALKVSLASPFIVCALPVALRARSAALSRA